MDSVGCIARSPKPSPRVGISRDHPSTLEISHHKKTSAIENENNEFQRQLTGGIYGIINSILCIPVNMSYATIIFSDPFFQPYMPSLSNLVCVSSMVHQLVFSSASSLPFAIGQVQDAGLIFLSAIASSIVHQLKQVDAEPDAIVATTLITIALGTATLGLALIVTGKLKLASLVQYLPMPVVGGYLAYIGFFCLQAGVAMMGNVELHSIMDWPKALTASMIPLIAPGILFGLLLFLIASNCKHFLALPSVLVLFPVVFYLGLSIFDISLDEARSAGYVPMPPERPPSPVEVFKLYDFSLVYWSVIPSQIVTWLGMLFVVAFSSSLDVAAIEMNVVEPLNYNYELQIVGVSNFVSGLCGGFTGSYIFSQTIFTLRSNTNTRISGILVIICEAIVFVLPVSLMAFVPKLFFGGLLTFIAVDLMMEWMIHSRHKLPWNEYLIVWLSFILINCLGLEAGLCAGIIVAAFGFLINYSKAVFVVRTPGKSTVQRNYHHRQILDKHRSSIVALELHGFLFFGSALQLMDCIQEHITSSVVATHNNANANESTSLLPVTQSRSVRKTEFVLLDFQYVTGIDTTATKNCLVAIKNLLERQDIGLVFTQLSDSMRWQLEANDVLPSPENDEIQDMTIHLFPSVDIGLEFCEDHILKKFQSRLDQHLGLFRPSGGPIALFSESGKMQSLAAILSSASNMSQQDKTFALSHVEDYFTDRVLKSGQVLHAVGNTSDSVYVVGQGDLEVFLDDGTSTKRLAKVSTGALIGEVDFYLNFKRSFVCRASSDCIVYELTREKLQLMQQRHPNLCILVQQCFLQCVSLMEFNRLLIDDSPQFDA